MYLKFFNLRKPQINCTKIQSRTAIDTIFLINLQFYKGLQQNTLFNKLQLEFISVNQIHFIVLIK
ncbi:hypothetical protein HNQ90_000632 [Algibacter amylolyticus]|nr:hypothetical protein [Algibacter amylolyticus]